MHLTSCYSQVSQLNVIYLFIDTCLFFYMVFQVTENALYTQFQCKDLDVSGQHSSQTTKPEDFEVGLVVIHDRVGGASSSTDEKTLKLKILCDSHK